MSPTRSSFPVGGMICITPIAPIAAARVLPQP